MGRVRKTKRPRKHHSLGKELAGCGTTPQPRNVSSEHKLAVDSGLPAQAHTDLVVADGWGSTPPKSKAVTQLESLENSVLPSSLELRAVDSGLSAQEHTDLVVNDECGPPPKSKAASLKTKRPRKHHSLGKELAGCGTTPQPRNVSSEHKLAVDSGLPAQEHTDLVVNDECGSTPPKSKAVTQLESLEDSVLSSSVELKAKELARKILLQVDAVDKTIKCGDIHRKPPRKFIDLDNAILSKLHFQERKMN